MPAAFFPWMNTPSQRSNDFPTRRVRRDVRITGWLLLTLAVATVWGQEPASRAPSERTVQAPAPQMDGQRARWALILEDAPIAAQISNRLDLRSARAAQIRSRIERAQTQLRSRLSDRGIRAHAATQTLLNAVYVAATAAEAAELAKLPGVARIEQMQPIKRAVWKANELVRAPQAWDLMGGQDRSGEDILIGIIDTGIDSQHPAFKDDSLQPISGFPRCREASGDCNFASNKVVAVRSYVALLAYWGDKVEWTRPDDLSPRDRVGHGTAVAMIAAGVPHDTPLGRVSGVAPKARLGNYKIFGSPGVNDVTFTDVMITALEDAFNDGMDVVTLSLSFPADWAPSDRGQICNLPSGQPCDARASAVSNAVRAGMAVVAAAGNEGDSGMFLPTLASIRTPGVSPEAITVGATTNSHRIYYSVKVQGDNVPDRLKRINALFSDGPRPSAAFTAELRDVSKLQDNGRACSPLTNGSLNNAFALIQAGECSLYTKVRHAQAAGALGVIFMRGDGLNFVFPPTGLQFTGIPLMLIGNEDGKALLDHLANNQGARATMDPSLVEVDAFNDRDLVAYFSSYGPAIYDPFIQLGSIKPELVAPGTDMYVATQRFDTNGDMYDASGYTTVQGTSFSVPMVAGAIALVYQKNPRWLPVAAKSAVVNTASDTIDDFDSSNRLIKARVTAVGAGKLNVENAVRADLVASPATIVFGLNSNNQIQPAGLTLANYANATASVRIRVEARDNDSNARVTVTPSQFTLQAGAVSNTIAVRLEGARPNPGSYEGALIVEGGAVPLRIPYLYVIGDGVPANVVPLKNFDFVGESGKQLGGGLSFKVIDKYGVPVPNVPVQFRSIQGGGTIERATRATDDLGIAEATTVILGEQIGTHIYHAEIPNLDPLVFIGQVRLRPNIATNSIMDAARNSAGPGIAPGSIIYIGGRGLSDLTLNARTRNLPLSLAGVSVSFDAPSQRVSAPGRLLYVSDEAVLVQAPWELQGLSSVLVKVSIGDSSNDPVSVSVSDQVPGIYLYRDQSSGRDIASAWVTEDGSRITVENGARRGSLVTLSLSGLGAVENQPPSGEPAAEERSSPTRNFVILKFGSTEVPAEFAGFSHLDAGTYRVIVRLPENLEPGLVPITATINGLESPQVMLPVR